MERRNGADRYVEVQQLQCILDNFSLAVGITSVVLDTCGEPITKPSVREGADARQKARAQAFWMEEEAAALRDRAASGHTPCWGLIDQSTAAAAVPLLIDGEYLGCWMFEKTVAAQGQNEEPAGGDQAIGRIIDMITAWDEVVGKLVLRTEHLQRVIRGFDDRTRQLQTFVDASETAMYVCDFHTGEMLMVNEAFCRQEGVDAAMAIGEKCWKVTRNSMKGFCAFCPRNKLVDKEDNTPLGVHVWEHCNQRLGKWMRVANKAIYWNGSRLAHMVTLVDITKERQLRDSLMYTAYYDRHTGLANMEKLMIDLREKQTDLDTGSVHLVCLQLKSMSQFNRGYGKKNGYSLFSVIGDWLQSLDEGVAVYRTEGYGFILLLANSSLKACKAIAKKIRAQFQEAWQLSIEGNPVYHYCSISGSIICFSRVFYHQDIDDLVERTLQSAVEAREFTVYDENLDQQEKRRVEFEISLKNQVRNGMDGFDVHYQPIVDAASGVWLGVEALCRWTDTSTGMAVSPGKFIPEAERLGLIGEIGEWVLERSVALCKELKLDEVEGFFLSVNMSFGQIMDEGFVERVANILETYGYPPEKLDLEVTESMEFHFNSFTMATIERFKQLGINLALDDFGTGYSSFSELQNLPAKYVKTERAFVDDIETDSQRQYFYYIISELAHMNGMKLIAEGVENEEQLDLVRKNGADLIQGYFFSKPLPKEQLGDCVMKFNMPGSGSELTRLSMKDLQHWRKAGTVQMVPPQLFHLMNQCIELLFMQLAPGQLIDGMLRLLGRHFGVGAAYACLFSTESAEGKAYDWAADSDSENRYHLTNEAFAQSRPYLEETFTEYGALFSSDITSLPPLIYDLLAPAGIRSILVLPVERDKRILGMVGLEDARHRGWQQNELLMLWNLSCMVRGIWEQANIKHDRARKNQMLSNILSATGVSIMVCDIDSAEILWVNDSRGKGVLSKDMVGKRCCEVIQGQPERCSFCQVPKLIAAGPGELLCREYHNERLGRTYMVYDGLLRWENNKLAHIGYFLEAGKGGKPQ